MTLLARFDVIGVPAPQGSKTRMPNGAMVEGSSTTGRNKTKAWRQAVAWGAAENADTVAFSGPLGVIITFRLPMPKSRPAVARRQGWWPHIVKPDIDKLLRATLDGLKDGGLIVDDSHICEVSMTADEFTGWTGARIVLFQRK